VHAGHHAQEAVHALEFFTQHGKCEVVHARTAVFGGEADAQKAQFAHFFDQWSNMRAVLRPFAVFGAAAVPGTDVRGDFALGELTHRLTQHVVFLVEEHIVISSEIHQ